jgi:hypothetical protein
MNHDQRFKALLQEFFAEFMRLFFSDWADRFEFAQVEWLEQEAFLDPPKGERRVMDLVAKLPTRLPMIERPGDSVEQWLVLIHIEIEAAESVEPLRARMWDYYRQLRHRHKLPVLPIGLYLKVGLNGIGWDVYEEWFWEHRLVHFEYAYIGLPALDGVQYVEGDNWLGVALAALMRIPKEDAARLAARTAKRLAECTENSYRRFLLWECAEAYWPLDDEQRKEFDRLLETEEYREGKAMNVTTYEKGQRDFLERLLTKRFGRLSRSVRARLAAWPVERLDQLADGLLAGQSLKDLGLEEGNETS